MKLVLVDDNDAVIAQWGTSDVEEEPVSAAPGNEVIASLLRALRSEERAAVAISEKLHEVGYL